MDNIKIFSTQRLIHLIKKSVYESKSNTLRLYIIMLGIFGVVYTISMLNGAIPINVLSALYFVGLFTLGVFASGMAFANFRNKERTMNYLSLPASNFEKFLSEFLISTLGFLLSYTLIFYLFNALVVFVSKSYHVEVEFFNLFDSNFLKNIRSFLIMHAVLFAGAATFKKVPPLNTGFYLFIIGIVLVLYTSLFAWIFINGMENTGIHIEGEFEETIMGEKMFQIARFAFFYLWAPIFWTVAFFKVKEKQA